jgi:hypothetical protein
LILTAAFQENRDRKDTECERHSGYFNENLGVEFPATWWINGG